MGGVERLNFENLVAMLKAVRVWGLKIAADLITGGALLEVPGT